MTFDLKHAGDTFRHDTSRFEMLDYAKNDYELAINPILVGRVGGGGGGILGQFHV